MDVVNAGGSSSTSVALSPRSTSKTTARPPNDGFVPQKTAEAALPGVPPPTSALAGIGIGSSRSGGDEVPAAARTLVLLSNDAVVRRGRVAAAERRASRPYKFVPKREGDRRLIEAFRAAVATARDRGLTNEHISAEIGESGMSANLISKVVHGHRGLGRFRPAVAAWSQSFSGHGHARLYTATTPGEDAAAGAAEDAADADTDTDTASTQHRHRHQHGYARLQPPLEDHMDVVDADHDDLAPASTAAAIGSGDADDVAAANTGGGSSRHTGAAAAAAAAAADTASTSYKVEARSDQDRQLLDAFRAAVGVARTWAWTNETIAKEIGAVNANVVSKLVHGHQGLGRYRDTVAAWTQHVLRLAARPMQQQQQHHHHQHHQRQLHHQQLHHQQLHHQQQNQQYLQHTMASASTSASYSPC